MVLKALNDMVLNGKPILRGEYIRTNNPALFLQRGYAAPLSKEEVEAVLNEYINTAKIVFPQAAARKEIPQIAPKKTVDQGRLL